jgi:hypothetical protein
MSLAPIHQEPLASQQAALAVGDGSSFQSGAGARLSSLILNRRADCVRWSSTSVIHVRRHDHLESAFGWMPYLGVGGTELDGMQEVKGGTASGLGQQTGSN